MTLGDPRKFLNELSENASRFEALSKLKQYELEDIRTFVKARNYELTNEPEVFRAAVAAFATVIHDYYGQQLSLRGLIRKRIFVRSKSFSAELLELFYRCVFEGLDLAPEGEALAS